MEAAIDKVAHHEVESIIAEATTFFAEQIDNTAKELSGHGAANVAQIAHPSEILSLKSLVNIVHDTSDQPKVASTHKTIQAKFPDNTFDDEEVEENTNNERTLEAIEYMLNRANELSNRGYAFKAQSFFEEVVRVRNDLCSKTSPAVEALFHQAKNTGARNEWGDAMASLQSVIALHISVDGGSNRRLADMLHAKGEIFASQGNCGEALESFKASEKMKIELYGDKHPAVGITLNAIIGVLVNLDRFTEAFKIAEKSYTMLYKAYGKSKVDVANAIFSKGRVMWAQGRLDDAKSAVEEATAMRTRLLGGDHVLVAEGALQMALICADIGWMDEAFVKLQQVNGKYLRYFPDTDVRLAEVAHHQATIYLKQGLLHESRKLFEKSLNSKLKFLGGEHIFTTDSYVGFAQELIEEGEYLDAREKLDKALTIRKSHYGPNHSKVAEAYYWKGELERRVGNFEQTKLCFDASLKIRVIMFGKDHVNYAQSELGLAELNADTENFVKAERLFKRAIKVIKTALGPKHAYYAHAVNSYGLCLVRAGKYLAALDALNTALDIRRKTFSTPDHITIAETLNNIALAKLLKFTVDEASAAEDKANALLGDAAKADVSASNAAEDKKQFDSVDADEEAGDTEELVFHDDAKDDDGGIDPRADEENGEGNTGDQAGPPEAASIEDEGVDVAKTDATEEKDENVDEDGLPVFSTTAYVSFGAMFQQALVMMKACVSNPEHPAIVNIQANLGIMAKLENAAKETFFHHLPVDIKDKIKAKRHVLEVSEDADEEPPIPGDAALDAAYIGLKAFALSENHPWMRKIVKYRAMTMRPPDDMAVARKLFKKAEENRKRCRFHEADVDYDEAMASQISILGPSKASANLEVAYSIYGKAENARLLGKLDISKKLYIQSMVICNKIGNFGKELSGKNTHGLAELLRLVGDFENAKFMVEKALVLFAEKEDGDGSAMLRSQIMLAHILCDLGSHKKGMEFAKNALDYVQERRCDPEELVDVHHVIGRIALQQGDILKATQSLEKAFALLKKLYPFDDHFTVAEVMMTRSRLKHVLGKYFDARKDVAKALKIRLALWGAPHLYMSSSRYSYTTGEFLQLVEDLIRRDEEVDEVYKGRFKDLHLTEVDEVEVESEDNKFAYVFEEERDRYLRLKREEEAASLPLEFKYRGQPVIGHPLIAESLAQRGLLCLTLAEYEEADSMFKVSLNMRKKMFGSGSVGAIEVLFYLSLIDARLGNLVAASGAQRKALDAQLELLGPEHQDRADTMCALAITRMDLGKLDDSLHIHQEALKIRERDLGKIHLKTCESYLAMAEVHRHKGEYSIANNFYTLCLNTVRFITPETHPLIGSVFFGQAEMKLALGEVDAAAALVEQATSIRSIHLGEEHPDTLISSVTVARVLRLRGKFQEAKVTLSQCMQRQQKILKENHPDRILSLTYMGCVNADTADYLTAKAQLASAVATVEASFGTDSAQYADVISIQADVLKAEARYEESKTLHSTALTIRRRIFGQVHASVADTMTSLGEIETLEGAFDAAMISFGQVLEMRRKVLGQMHRDVAYTLYNIASVLVQQGKLGEAMSMAERSLAMREQLLSFEHYMVIESRCQIACIQRLEGKLEVSWSTLSRCLPMLRDSFGSRHPIIASVLLEMGRAADELAKFEDAKSYLQSALEMQTAIFGGVNQSHPDIWRGYCAIAENSRKLGMYTQVDDDGRGNFRVNEKQLSKVSDSGDVIFALPMFQRALKELGKTLKEDHPTILSIKFSIAETLHCLGRYREAKAFYEKVLFTRRVVLSDDHIDTIESYWGLAEILRATAVLYPAEEKKDSVDDLDDTRIVSTSGSTLTVADQISSALGVKIPNTMPCHPSKTIKLSASLPKDAFRELSSAEMRQGLSSANATGKRVKLKKILPRGGYMGYSFPEEKNLMRQPVTGCSRPPMLHADDCKWLYEHAAKLLKKLVGEDTNIPLMGSILFGQGELFRARKSLEKANVYLTMSLEMRKHLFRWHPSIADCLHSLGEILRDELKYSEAFSFYTKSKDLRMQFFGTLHPSIADVDNSLAINMYHQGRFVGAETMYFESLQMRELLLGSDHVSVAQSLNNLAGLLHAEGRYSEAEPMYRRALTIKTAAFGENHADVASAMNNLALLLKVVGKGSEALEVINKTLKIQRTLFGMQSFEVAVSLHNLAGIYALLGRRVEARDTFRASIEIKRKVVGDDHPSLAATLNNFAGLLHSMDELDDARDLYTESFKIRRRTYGTSHPTVAESLNNIALVYYSEARFNDARPLFQQAVDIKKVVYGPDHVAVADSLNNLGSCLQRAKLFDEANVVFDEVSRIRRLHSQNVGEPVGERGNDREREREREGDTSSRGLSDGSMHSFIQDADDFSLVF